jgi:hypothetical protein
MKLQVYAVYDTKAEAFGQPFFMNADGIAVRSFIEACKNENGEFIKYPNDFTMYQIGTYDDSNACLTYNKPKELITAAQALSKKDKK